MTKEMMRKAHKLTKEMKQMHPEVNYQLQLGLFITFLLEEEKEMTRVKPMDLRNMPKLEGTDKQVEWATKIRLEIIKDIAGHLKYDELGRPIAGPNGLLEKYITDKEVTEEQERKLSERFERWNKLVSTSDSKFWIDNRTNQAENYMNKKLTKQIIG